MKMMRKTQKEKEKLHAKHDVVEQKRYDKTTNDERCMRMIKWNARTKMTMMMT